MFVYLVFVYFFSSSVVFKWFELFFYYRVIACASLSLSLSVCEVSMAQDTDVSWHLRNPATIVNKNKYKVIQLEKNESLPWISQNGISNHSVLIKRRCKVYVLSLDSMGILFNYPSFISGHLYLALLPINASNDLHGDFFCMFINITFTCIGTVCHATTCFTII